MHGIKGMVGGLAGLLLIAALAVGTSGCGGSDDSGGSNDASAASSQPTGDKAQVADVMKDLRDIYIRSDGDGFCSRLTPDGIKEVEVLVGRDPNAHLTARDCAGIVTEFSKRVVGGGQKQRPVNVRKVKVNGTKAKAVITGGLAGVRRIVPYRLEKIGGEWKLDDPITGASRSTGMDYSIRLDNGAKTSAP
jgi:hypothetical protein